ncbi:thioredoxin family protein [Nonlabens ponticola]|uniref:Thioredoxin family protein n=1 Tax=Nonlabens ponticola TaxID=2496866 RepID=A0A3S9MVX4_9FLAO|nr:thioredoxin family protein [Nonlabens ponticola]AZQ43292.1 thioredoxin family protein [Nonlabens ponticola]
MNINTIISDALESSMPYEQYRALVESHVHNDSNTGAEVTEALAEYTKLNHQRMRRHNKKMELTQESLKFLTGFDKQIKLLCITESWCGDAAQTMPMINKVAVAGGMDFRIVLRDENLELMDQFLTNGNRSIAKLIFVDSTTNSPLATWGPRPTVATRLVAAEKEAKGSLSPEFKQELQNWYNKDKGKSTEADLVKIMQAL